MRKLTQTVTAKAENGWVGNCWQTCVAMLLDIDPEVMPAQAECDKCTTTEDGKRGSHIQGSPDYYTRLQAYLRTHHGLAYVELHQPEEIFGQISIAAPGWHMMTGRTIRSDAYKGMRHVVVARYGQMVWDPHPSRAGLLEEIRWAFLIPYPKLWKRNMERQPCVCPLCRLGVPEQSPPV